MAKFVKYCKFYIDFVLNVKNFSGFPPGNPLYKPSLCGPRSPPSPKKFLPALKYIINNLGLDITFFILDLNLNLF